MSRSFRVFGASLLLPFVLSGWTCNLPPPAFLWGAGTAAYQHEGGNTNADWYHFEDVPGAIANGDHAGTAADFYNRYASDFDLAQSLGHNAHRLSIEWSRVEPQKDVWNTAEIEHYRQVLNALWARGMEPVVTLNHFTLPLWVQDPAGGPSLGGWASEQTVDQFVEFATRMAQEFGGKVDRWLSINEPMVLVTNGYSFGEFPPAHSFDTTGALDARAHLIEAIARSYDAIKANDHIDANGDGIVNAVGIAHNFFHYSPLNPASQADATAVQKWEYFYMWSMLDTLTSGNFDYDLDGNTTSPGTTPAEGHHAEFANRLDFIGVNYYGRFVIADGTWVPPLIPWLTGLPQPDPNPTQPRNDVGWESDPAGLTSLMGTLNSRYHLPLLVTENGMLTTNDLSKTHYLFDHVDAVLQAKAAGATVWGYLDWALLDTFEWTFGNQPGFGLIAIDPATQSRRVTMAGNAFKEVIAAQGVTPSIRSKYATDPFPFGTSSSAYEMEGNDTHADLTEWELMGKCVNGQVQGAGADHYDRFEEDFQQLDRMGATLNKVVLEWPRIETAPGVYDAAAIAHYHAVIDSLRAKGITPIVALQHFSLPTWVNSPMHPTTDMDGWVNPSVAYAFEAYAVRMATEFGATVDWWQTVNEPEFMSLLAYAVGLFPPGNIDDTSSILNSMQIIALANARAYAAIHAHDVVDADGDGVAARVSFASSVNEWIPTDPNDPADVAARDKFERFANWMAKDLATSGNLDSDLDGVYDVNIPSVANSIDYITITNYTRFRVNGPGNISLLGGVLENAGFDAGVEVMDNGQEIYPQGLYNAIRTMWERYGLPIMVGENGVFSLNEAKRAAGLVRNVHYMQLARYQGIPVLGYMYWSLIDPFQVYIGFQHGIGLHSVDFATGVRTETPLFGVYQQVIAAGGSTYDLLDRYPPTVP